MNVVNLGCVGFYYKYNSTLLPLQNDQHNNAYFTTNWLEYFTITLLLSNF